MNEKTLWILLTAIGTLGTLALGAALRSLNTRIRSVYDKFQSPQLSFRYDAHDVCVMMDILKEKGVAKLFDRFCLLMAAMMAEVLMVLMVVAHNITDLVWIEYAMFGLSGVIWLTGTLETLILRNNPKVAGQLSLIKWGAFAVWTLAMFAGLFIRSTAY